jgi:hypothetical protein
MDPLALDFLRKYVERNPYTGGAVFDIEAASKDPSWKRFLATIWTAGYDAGFMDGDGDSYVEQQHNNPYL